MQSGQRKELHKPKIKSTFHLLQLNPKRNRKLFYVEGGQALQQVDQKDCRVSTSLEILNIQLDNVLSNLLQFTLLRAGGWTRKSPEGVSNLNCSGWRPCFGPAFAWNRLKMCTKKFSEDRDRPASSLQTAWMSREMQIPCSTKLGPLHRTADTAVYS